MFYRYFRMFLWPVKEHYTFHMDVLDKDVANMEVVRMTGSG